MSKTAFDLSFRGGDPALDDLMSLQACRGPGSDGVLWENLEEGREPASPHIITLRPVLSRQPGPAWENLWDRIDQRLEEDPALQVPGFTDQELATAFASLRRVFSAQWIRQAYKQAGATDMAAPLTHLASRRWFPAYHLSRLATGVLCRDPALHALVELGLALDSIEDMPGREELEEALAADTALDHQVCLAAELLRRGLLVRAEGEAPGDLRVILDEGSCLLRTRAASLRNVLGDIQSLLEEASGEGPMILHVPISGNGWYRPELGLPQDLDDLALPARMPALVVGRRFLDANGGPFKRNAQKVIHNDRVSRDWGSAALEGLFAPNYQSYDEPALNTGTHFYLK